MAIRATQQYVDVFGTVNGAVRVASQFVEILWAPGASESVTSNLSLSQNWFEFNYVADRQVPQNTITFIQVASASGFHTVEDNLNLTDSVDVRGPIPLYTHSQLVFSHLARNTCHNIRVGQGLGITDYARIPLPTQHVTSTMNLSDLAYMSFIDQAISFSHVAVGGRAAGVQVQTISFVHTLTSHGTLRRTLAHDLGISQALTYLDDTPCNRKNYTPFMGEGSANAPSASLVNPQFNTSPGNRFLLYWPARGARQTEVSIRAPQFGNRDRNAYTRVNRETRGGRLVVFSDPTWPKVRTMAVTVTGLLKTEVDEIQSLFYEHLGQLIGITDWEGYEGEGG